MTKCTCSETYPDWDIMGHRKDCSMTQDWKEKLGKWADENQWSINETEHVMYFIESLLAEERNAVLSEVEKEVEKEYGDEHPRAQAITKKDISTIIKSLRV